jgi:hypothetical protein
MTVWLINCLAIGFLLFLAIVVLRFAIRGAIRQKHLFEATRVLLGMVSLMLAVSATRGEIGHWGFWVGGGMLIAGTAMTLFL